MPIMMFCTGKARETALSASLFRSEMRETNMLSTTLYSACTSIDRAIGSAMPSSSRPTGITPILFSFKLIVGINHFLIVSQYTII